MSGHRSSPLRDRLLSNSPDPIKSSILRESGKGWSSPPPDDSDQNATSPLRISKRGSPLPSVARRASSSYRHARNNHLVSKSPFKSQTPTNSHTFPFPTRKVSGEKRPRPSSMHDQAESENNRPFSLKRERRQSKTYQGLIQKEPVTRSPFLQTQTSQVKSVATPSRIPTLNTTSPVRSSLVSRRLHGPRFSGGGRRERRKTVTFDERCDVVEIDYEEEEGQQSQDVSCDSDIEMDVASGTLEARDESDPPSADDSYESIQLSDAGISPVDPDSSITGIVDQMLASDPPTASPADILTDLETEGADLFGPPSIPAAISHQSGEFSSSPHGLSPSSPPQINESFQLQRSSPIQEEQEPDNGIRADQPSLQDALALPSLQDEPLPAENELDQDSLDPSVYHDRSENGSSSPPQSDFTSPGMLITRATFSTPERQLPIPPSTPPLTSKTSSTGENGTSSHWINREDVQRRILRQRSSDSLIPGKVSSTPMTIETEPIHYAHDDDGVNDTSNTVDTEDVNVPDGVEQFGLPILPKEEGRLQLDFGSNSTEFSRTHSPISGVRMEVGTLEVDMEMRSALDRLMDDVAGGKLEDTSMTTDEADSCDEAHSDFAKPRMMQRAATDSAVIMGGPGITSRSVSSSSTLSVPPPPLVPSKDNIRSREALILEKRREMRRLEEEGVEALQSATNTRNLTVASGRPSRRRSMSTGDVLDRNSRTNGSLLDIGLAAGSDDPLGDSIEKELQRKLAKPGKIGYQIREHEVTIYASSGGISHMTGPGDVNPGKAWKTVRRPSDMNEFSKQIREYREQEKTAKAYGKIFVKVIGVKGINVPIPSEPTVMTCTLNNGIHFVTTPDGPFSKDCRIEQEFELIEHSKLEFILTLKIRRDPHIISQFKALAPPLTPPVAPAAQTSSKGGMRSFFSSSPKKPKDKSVKPTPSLPVATQRLPDNLARYLKADGTLARAFISFKDISHRCDTRLFETTFPLIGQRMELGNKFSTLQVGELALQLFRLPPLPGFSPDELPQSLDECHRGLRHINWHKVTYFEGTLTQCGGDCNSWRRRHLRVIGSNLVAFNDVTKRATATINLKKAVAVEDGQNPGINVTSPSSQFGSRYDEYEGLYGVERSFRLIFPDDEILFFADTDEEKSRWLDVLRALVGHIPPHPLWAELLWQRQEESSKNVQAAGPSRKPVPPA